MFNLLVMLCFAVVALSVDFFFLEEVGQFGLVGAGLWIVLDGRQ